MHISVQNLMKILAFISLLVSLTTVNLVFAQEPNNEGLGIDATETAEIKSSDLPEPEIEIQRVAFEPQVRYISDEFFVPLRETPCPRCKIVHWGIKSGVVVDLLDLKDGWGLVSTANGYKGWMEEQFIAESPSGRQQLGDSQLALKDAAVRIKQFEDAIVTFKNEIKSLQLDNQQLESDKKIFAKEFSEMEGISADPAALNQQNQTLVKQNHLLQSDNDVLKAEVEILENDSSNQFFLYGALTVFLAALLVAFIPKLKGRKRLSEWG